MSNLRNLLFPSKLINRLNVPQLKDITDNLPRNTAYSWRELAGERSINDLTTIAIHHTGVARSQGATPTSHANYHITSRLYNDPSGEPGIPYHFYIKDGQPYQVNDVLDRTYGVGSNNAYTVHVVVEGEYYKTDTLTDADRNCLYAVCLLLMDTLPNFKEIKGHKEFPQNNTDCPGYDHVRVRNDVATIHNQLQYAGSDEAKKAKAFEIANEILYLYNMAKDSQDQGQKEWAVSVLMDLHPFMKDKQLL